MKCAVILWLSITAPMAFASDILLVNGHIYTGNPAAKWVQAISISGTRIDALGTNDEIMRRKEPATRVIDLPSALSYPALSTAIRTCGSERSRCTVSISQLRTCISSPKTKNSLSRR